MHKFCLLFLIISQPLLSMDSKLPQRPRLTQSRSVSGPTAANWWNQPLKPHQPTKVSHMRTRTLLGITGCTLAYAYWKTRQTHAQTEN